MTGRCIVVRDGDGSACALEIVVACMKDLNLARTENTHGATVLQVRRPTSRARDPNSRPPKPFPSFRAKNGENNLVRERVSDKAEYEIKCTRSRA